MRVRVGTSGYSYAPWKGRFYPADLKPADMLRFYAGRLPTVEINNTFYRMPAAKALARWAEETPAGFSFVLKAARRITHEKRLHDADGLAYFFENAAVLGDKLGPVLFQLPPFFKKDVGRLRDALALVPDERQVAFEFRHATWFDDEVYGALRDRGAALCLADTDEAPDPALVPTADWGYLRLRRADYDDAAIATWADRVRAQPWGEAWVFFKHEEAGKGPALAARLIDRLGDASLRSAG
ncbi:MAG: DUF72 domain-containing protein [Acidobacteria bacterium]|nr:DUF72 domain-containing protein [Acidobacteriota bacterium]